VFLAAAIAYSPLAFIAFGMFGLGYIIATGVLLLWGISIYNRRPALGLSIPFLVVAVGQTAGAPVFGMALDASDSITALGAFSIVMAIGASFAAREAPFSRRPSL
jgi:predicted MFS family arabinose efflux permease